MLIGANSVQSKRFNTEEFKQKTFDYLRHAKESHSWVQNDLLDIYEEGAKSPSNALIHLYNCELDYKKQLKDTLPRDEYNNKIAVMQYNLLNAQKECLESRQFQEYTDAIEKMYKKSWVLRTQLILSGRFYGGVRPKLSGFLKRPFKKFMPKNIEETMLKIAKKGMRI